MEIAKKNADAKKKFQDKYMILVGAANFYKMCELNADFKGACKNVYLILFPIGCGMSQNGLYLTGIPGTNWLVFGSNPVRFGKKKVSILNNCPWGHLLQ
jgi:hypothetical protein